MWSSRRMRAFQVSSAQFREGMKLNYRGFRASAGSFSRQLMSLPPRWRIEQCEIMSTKRTRINAPFALGPALHNPPPPLKPGVRSGVILRSKGNTREQKQTGSNYLRYHRNDLRRDVFSNMNSRLALVSIPLERKPISKCTVRGLAPDSFWSSRARKGFP